ncbi:hypothetical protein [Aureimonas sp. AU12]|nr:hypothetical protein [Aureimonas sp. AU12]
MPSPLSPSRSSIRPSALRQSAAGRLAVVAGPIVVLWLLVALTLAL